MFKKYLLILAAYAASGMLADSTIYAAPKKIERKLFTAAESTEAVLKMQPHLQIVSRTVPTNEVISEKIESQLVHMFGPLAEHSATKAVPKGEHQITNVQVAEVSRGLYKVTYDYEGTLLVKQARTQRGQSESLEILLPVNPDTIFAAGVIGNRNPCTDSHHPDEGDFWYFWSPSRPGCRLTENLHYFKVSGSLERKENVEQSFPEYERLADANGNITISILMGLDDPEKNTWNPMNSRDINAPNFRQIRQMLIQQQYQPRQWAQQEIEQIAPRLRSKELPYVEEFSKKLEKATIVVRMFFGATGIDEKSKAFHHFFKDSVENSSIMIYGGHSGLGGHLDLPSIEQTNNFKIQPNQSRYQIYYFNSCSSYTYYNSMFFNRKKTSSDPKGTKNLDIMTNGLATYFHVIGQTNYAVIQSVELWAAGTARASYQAIAKKIDSNNLFGINGDEDNPKE